MSTALADNDSFFDDWDDGDDDQRRQPTAKRDADSPVLKGPYDRGGTSDTEPEPEPEPVTKSKSLTPSTSGNFSAKSSDSAMSSGKRGRGTGRQYDDYSPSPSRSPSPYRNSPAYSDSFNSEDSDQDSRQASPEIVPRKASSRHGGNNRAQGTRKGGTATNSRFNSGTSQDSRSTSKSYGGSTYGGSARTNNRKGFQKTPVKKGPNATHTKPRSNSNVTNTKPRSNSNASSMASPRNGAGNEVARRMLSAKGHTISRLRNEYNQLQQEHDEMARENKLLKALQRRQERALAKFDSEESELPQLLKKHSAELDSMRRRIRKYQERDKDKDKRLRDKDDQCLRADDELKKLRRLADDKGLLEREDLQRRVGKLEDQLAEKDQRVGELESHVRNLKKNQRRELKERHAKGEEAQGALQALQAENERLQMQIKEKEKELDVRNIYSNRLIKPPSKLRGNNPSPTAHRPMMVSKATSTQEDDIATPTPPRTPHPPSGSQSRDRSAEEERRRRETAARVKSPMDATAAAVSTTRESSKETTSTAKPATKDEPSKEPPPKKEEELSEHEKIMRDLDMGWGKRAGGGGGGQQQQQADAGKRRDEEEERRRREAEERKKKEREEEERRQEQELEEMRRKEEEERRKRQEEDAARNREGAQDQDKKKKEALRRALLSDSDEDEEEENVPFFGSKPGNQDSKPTPPSNQSPAYAVNSVRDLHKYSRGDSSDTSQQQQQQQDNAGSMGQNRAANTNSAEERRKKDLLLARMREIDDGKKPESGRSRKNYNFTQPVENLHNGRPSHPDSGSSDGGGSDTKNNKDTSLTFGSYAPTFGKTTAPPKSKKKSFFVDDDDDDDDDDSGADLFAKPKPAATKPKGDLMADLFGGSGGGKSGNAENEDKTNRSSFNDDKNVFTSSTKAKPVSYPWEKKVDTGQGTGKSAKASPNMARDSLDEADDLEEVLL